MGLFGRIFAQKVEVTGRITIGARTPDTYYALSTFFIPSAPGAPPPSSVNSTEELVAAGPPVQLNDDGDEVELVWQPCVDPGRAFRAFLAPGHWQIVVFSTPFLGRTFEEVNAGRLDASRRQSHFPLPKATEVRAGVSRTLSLKIDIREVATGRIDPEDSRRYQHAAALAERDPEAAVRAFAELAAAPRTPDPLLRPMVVVLATSARANALVDLGRAADAFAALAALGDPEQVIQSCGDPLTQHHFLAARSRTTGRMGLWEEMRSAIRRAIEVLGPMFTRGGVPATQAREVASIAWSWCIVMAAEAKAWPVLLTLAEDGLDLARVAGGSVAIDWLARCAGIEGLLATGREQEAEAAARQVLKIAQDYRLGVEELRRFLDSTRAAKLPRSVELLERSAR